jgi:hypothetical protein
MMLLGSAVQVKGLGVIVYSNCHFGRLTLVGLRAQRILNRMLELGRPSYVRIA